MISNGGCDKATEAIARVATIGEAKALTDKVAVIKLLAAKQGWSAEHRAKIAEIELRTTVRLGELLKETDKAGKGQPKKKSSREEEFSARKPTNAELLGIDNQAKANKIAHLAETAASVPEEKREQYIADNAAKGKVSVSGFVKEHKKEEKRKEQLEAIKDTVLPSGKYRIIASVSI